MKTRRDFLRLLSLTGIGLLIQNMTGCANKGGSKKRKEVGIQLWTLRDMIKEDLYSTLEALGKMGYTSIETYGFDGSFYAIPAKEFRALCSGLGLTVHSSHCSITAMNAASYAEKAAEAGMEYLILPSMMGRPATIQDDFKRTAGEMNRIGEICRKYDISFGYHNHDFEFNSIDNQIPYDIFLNETDPELVCFQLDIYWVKKAGYNPIDYFSSYPGRFKTWHVKDMGNDGESCIVGNGSIDFKALMACAEKAGLQRIFVEQEHYTEGTPLYCAEQSLRYIQLQL